jgi:hypothetical protein
MTAISATRLETRDRLEGEATVGSDLKGGREAALFHALK